MVPVGNVRAAKERMTRFVEQYLGKHHQPSKANQYQVYHAWLHLRENLRAISVNDPFKPLTDQGRLNHQALVYCGETGEPPRTCKWWQLVPISTARFRNLREKIQVFEDPTKMDRFALGVSVTSMTRHTPASKSAQQALAQDLYHTAKDLPLR